MRTRVGGQRRLHGGVSRPASIARSIAGHTTIAVVLASASAAGALSLIVPSLAAGAGKSGSKHKGRSSAPKALPAPAVKSESWLVKVNGQEHAVKNGGTFTYSPGDEIESITPKVLIVATKKGAYGYGYRFDGPKGAETGITEGSFEGTQDSLAPPFIPLALVYGPEGKITNEATMFSPGGYRFELRLYGSTMHATFFLEEFERKKPALTATLTLAEK